MERYIIQGGKRLRCGHTTGSCAAAAAKAAATMLLGGEDVVRVRLDTPKGWVLELPVLQVDRAMSEVSCAIEKDGGDDPDVTHGLLIHAKVNRIKGGIKVLGGEGVGRVTLPGLACAVGDAAINPVPREMIRKNLEEVARIYGYEGGLSVEISVPGGKETARKTFNRKLGIVDGISILGTSGIVEPMSESALKRSLELEVNILKEKGYKQLLLCPGNYGKRFATEELKLGEKNLVKIGNFVGHLFSYAAEQGVEEILYVSHLGKAIKILGGMKDTHSKYGDCRLELLAAYGIRQDMRLEALKEILDCVSTDAVVEVMKRENCLQQVLDSILMDLEFQLAELTSDKTRVGVVLFNHEHGLLGTGELGKEMLGRYAEGI